MIGIILAGGLSTRFGSQKAFHEIDGKPFYVHVYDAMAASGCFEEIIINTNEDLKDDFPGNVIVDLEDYQNLGPLGGIYSVMAQTHSDAYFVVSVDTPFITAEAIGNLAAVYLEQSSDENSSHHNPIVIYAEDRTFHPTIGIYPESLKEDIKKRLDNGELKLRALFDDDTIYVPVSSVPGEWYVNINSLDDLAAQKEGDLNDGGSER